MGEGYFGIFKRVVRREWDFLWNVRRKLLFFCLISSALSFGIMLAVFYSPVVRKAPIAVIDNDRSNISRELIIALNASPDLRVAFELAGVREAKRLLADTSVYGVVIIPEDFSKKVLGYKGAEVPFYYNSQLFLIGGTVNRGVVSAVQDFAGRYNKIFEESEGVPVYASADKAAPIIFDNKILFNPYLNYQYFMLIGLLPAMFQIFVVGSFVYSFGFELKTGRAESLAESIKRAPFTTVAAKSFPYWIIFTANGVAMLYFLFVCVGAPLEGSRTAILLATFLFVMASTSVCMVILFLGFGSMRMGLSITAVYAAPAFAYAGVTFPAAGMPKAAELWSEFLPITHYHRILINDAVRGASHSGTPWDMLYLFLFFFLCFVTGTIMYRFLVTRPGMWGKE